MYVNAGCLACYGAQSHCGHGPGLDSVVQLTVIKRVEVPAFVGNLGLKVL